MTTGSRLLRSARQVVARLPLHRFARVPDAPTQPVRDPWPGDINLGVRLLRVPLDPSHGPADHALVVLESLARRV